MKIRLCSWIIALILLATGCVQNAQAAIRRVDKHATGTPIDGSTWARAHRDLQDALVGAPPGTDIWVAAETYTPGSAQSDSFGLRDGVWIYGGFLGTRHPTLPTGETNLGERDFLNNLTILSGDIGVVGVNGDNCYCVVVASGVPEAILDGFTVTGGNGGYSNGDGAGIYVDLSSHPTISNCLITHNRVPAESGTGAGMFIGYFCLPVLNNCTFLENRGGYGAGLWVNALSDPVLSGCRFIRNIAAKHSGGMYVGPVCSALLVSCIFIGNEAHQSEDGGGALAVQGYLNDVQVINCLFDGNSAFGDGG